MTREEVIKILSLIKSTVFLGNRKFLDALDRAIEFLKQSEPCEDTISRKAAIDAGLRLCGMDTKMELINLCEASIADSEGRAGAILDYIGELEDLPSAPPE